MNKFTYVTYYLQMYVIQNPHKKIASVVHKLVKFPHFSKTVQDFLHFFKIVTLTVIRISFTCHKQ